MLGYKVVILAVIFLLSACNTETAIKNETPDPVLVEYPVVYIERTLDTQTDENEAIPARFVARDPALFRPTVVSDCYHTPDGGESTCPSSCPRASWSRLVG